MAQEKIGKFVIEQVLGRGSMGTVYLAFDPVLRRRSAIKLMNTSAEVNQGLRERFLLEAVSVARLRHPNIIGIYEMGEHKKAPFIAMEYVEGEDLKTLIENKVFIPFDHKLELMIRVCEGLDYAHRNGIVHRDIKPGNIRVTRDGDVRILDFGLVRLDSAEVTRPGLIMGSPYYMSPEQVRGIRDLDGRSDLFSVGVLLYELITYRRPFEAETSMSVCHAIISDSHPPLSQALPGCAKELVEMVDRALAKDRKDRFSNGEEFATALRAFKALLPTKHSELIRGLESLQTEFGKCRREASNLRLPDLLDPSLFDVPEPVYRSADSVRFPKGPSATSSDYGRLLSRYGLMQQRTKEIAPRLQEVSRLMELSKRGRSQLESNEVEACLATVDEILRISPKNANAAQMRDECQRRLGIKRGEEERYIRLNSLVQQARQAFDQGNLKLCLQTASRALQLEPANSQALELKRLASQWIERQQKVEELFGAALQRNGNRDYEACYELTRQALELEPDHAELKKLHDQAKKGLARAKRIKALLEQAHRLEQTPQLRDAVEVLNEALTLDPSNREALDLREAISEKLNRRQAIQRLLRSAEEHGKAHNHEACCVAIQEALDLDPDNVELKALYLRAREALDKARNLDQLRARCHEQIERKEYEAALETANTMLGLEPGSPMGLEMRDLATAALDRRRRAEELLAVARRQYEIGDYTACRQAAAQALILEPESVELQTVRDNACAALERIERINFLLTQTQKLLQEGEPSAASQAVTEVLILEPGHAQALELKRQIAQFVERREKVQKLLSVARAAFEAGDHQQSHNVATQALQLEPNHPDLRNLQERSLDLIRRTQRVAELQESANQHLRQKDYSAALEELEELLHLDDRHSEGRALHLAASKGLERQRKVNELLNEARECQSRQDLAACHKVATEALELEPDHEELKELQEHSAQVLEKKRRAENLLERAGMQLQQGDHHGALSTLTEVLSIEAETEKALELKGIISQALERRQKVDEFLTKAYEYDRSKNYQGCYRISTAGLALEPEHAELRALQQRSQEIIERTRKARSLLDTARQKLQQEDYRGVIEIVSELSLIEPDNAIARELKQAAEEALETRRKVEECLVRARQCAELEDFDGCLESATEGLKYEPAQAELRRLQERSRQAIERTQKINQLFEAALGYETEKDYQNALVAIEKLLAIQPDHGRALELRSIVTEAWHSQRRVQELRTQILERAGAGDYQDCRRLTEEALKYSPGDPELEKIRQQAIQALERTRQIEQLAQEARQQLDRGAIDSALQTSEEALSLDTGNVQAQEVKRVASERLDHRRKLQVILAEARELYDAKDYNACYEITTQGLDLEPEQSELTELQQSSSRALEMSRRLFSLLDAARQQYLEKDYVGLMGTVEEVLSIEPGNGEATELKRLASAAMQQEEKIKNLRRVLNELYDWLLKAAEDSRQRNQLLGKGHHLLQTRDFKAASDTAQILLRIEPESTQALELRKRANAAQQGHPSNERVEVLLATARECLLCEDYDEGMKTVLDLRAVDPEDPQVEEIEQWTRAARSIHKIEAAVKELLLSEIDDMEHQDLLFEIFRDSLSLEVLDEELTEILRRYASVLKEVYPPPSVESLAADLLNSAEEQFRGKGYPYALRYVGISLELRPDDLRAFELQKLITAEMAPKERPSSPLDGVPLVFPRPAQQTAKKNFVGYWVLAALVLVLAAGAVWTLVNHREASVVPEEKPGILGLSVSPWATVDSIINVRDSRPITYEAGLVTPCTVSLPPGDYRVKVSNPKFGPALEFDVNVAAGKATRVHRVFQDFHPEREIDRVLGSKQSQSD